MLNSAFSLYGQQSSDLVFAVRRAVVDTAWYAKSTDTALTTLRDVKSVSDVWSFLQGPIQSALFQDTWYNGDRFADDVESQLGIVDRTSMLLGGVELRLIRVSPTASCNLALPQHKQDDPKWCYPHYTKSAERKTLVSRLPYFEDTWTPAPTHSDYEAYRGSLAGYPGSGYRRFLLRLGTNVTADRSDDCDSRCELAKLRRGRWLDESSRALFVRYNLYNAAMDLHCVVQLLFEFGVATAGSAEGRSGEVIASAEITPLHLNQYPGLFVIQPRFLTEVSDILPQFAQYSCGCAFCATLDLITVLLDIAKKLRATASKGVKKLQRVTRGLLSVSDEAEKLLDLKKAWGLEQDHLQLESVPEGKVAKENELTNDGATRLHDMFARLGSFQLYLGEELGPDEFAENVNTNEVVQIKKIKQTERSEASNTEEMRGADLPASDSPDDSSIEVQASAGLPGAVMDANEEAEAVAQTMHAHT
ncbi:unnamed protein product [Phytophthora lilii]|uniref:Unnamed protein product n=1 Tax=Phytophthora lilii TaxID=2077276 RepID=A0A9W6X2Q4_9STRA|nr:unnamed protein product [Phytophthora lilii]